MGLKLSVNGHARVVVTSYLPCFPLTVVTSGNIHRQKNTTPIFRTEHRVKATMRLLSRLNLGISLYSDDLRNDIAKRDNEISKEATVYSIEQIC